MPIGVAVANVLFDSYGLEFPLGPVGLSEHDVDKRKAVDAMRIKSFNEVLRMRWMMVFINYTMGHYAGCDFHHNREKAGAFSKNKKGKMCSKKKRGIHKDVTLPVFLN